MIPSAHATQLTSVSLRRDFQALEKLVRSLRKELGEVRLELSQSQKEWKAITSVDDKKDTAELDFQKALYAKMVEHLNIEDFIVVCFNLGIDWEDLHGDTKNRKIIELIELMDRREEMYKLIGECQRLYAQILWPTP